MISHCGLHLHFPELVITSFHVLVCHPYIVFNEMSLHICRPCSNWIVCFLLLSFQPFFRYVVFKYFLSECKFSLHHLHRVFHRPKFLILVNSNLPIFFFSGSGSWCHMLKLFTKLLVPKNFSYGIS